MNASISPSIYLSPAMPTPCYIFNRPYSTVLSRLCYSVASVCLSSVVCDVMCCG